MPAWRTKWPMLLFLASGIIALWLWRASAQDDSLSVADYSEVYGWLQKNQVEAVVINGRTMTGTLRSQKQTLTGLTQAFTTILPDGDTSLLPLLLKQKVQIRATMEQRFWGLELLMSALPWFLVLGVWLWLSRRTRNTTANGGPLGSMLKNRSRKFESATSIGVTFDDVAGLSSAKRDLQEIVLFLKDSRKFNRLGGKVPRGVLLIGPPGTGKTLLARAVAGESRVPFFSITASEFIEMFVGVGAARVRDLFVEAKKHSPAIVFIDEIDAVGRSRGTGLGGGHDEREQTLNQLLSEMDGFERNDLTIVIAATNRPDVLDPALIRPGRFDRHVFVERPEPDSRKAILEVHTKDVPLAASVDLAWVARHAPGFSGADLANLVNEAALQATRRGADSVEATDFSEAFDRIILGDPSEALLGVEEKRRVAIHESGHAIVARFSDGAEPLARVSIIPRGIALGVTQQTPSEEHHILTEPQLQARVRILMAGYAAERVVFGSISTGAENDLKAATKLASNMVAHFGMSENLGPVYYDHDAEHPFLGQRIATDGGASDATTQIIEREARELLARGLQGAVELIEHHRVELETLVLILLEKETVGRDELQALLGPPVAVGSG